MKKLVTILAVIAVAVGFAAFVSSCGESSPSRPGINAASDDVEADWSYVIPAGTGDRIDGGERIEIIPATLEVRVGDVLRIVNEDDRGHVIGAFYVAAGETLTQTFSAPGELSGECSVHPSGSFTLTVRA